MPAGSVPATALPPPDAAEEEGAADTARAWDGDCGHACAATPWAWQEASTTGAKSASTPAGSAKTDCTAKRTTLSAAEGRVVRDVAETSIRTSMRS